VTLRQEPDALNLYLGIEQLRFGDRLRLEFEVDEAAYSGLVPIVLFAINLIFRRERFFSIC